MVGVSVGAGWVMGQIGVPSGYLFAALLTGLCYALLAPGRLMLPAFGFQVGQAVTGVALGTFLQADVLTGLGSRWIPVILVSVATLAVTIGAGIMLARVSVLDRPTASLGMVAGGASGIVAMAGDLGADDRLVAFMQYLRVLIITLLTPLLVPVVFGLHAKSLEQDTGPVLGTLEGWALTIGASVIGSVVARPLRIPAPPLLGPLLLTCVLVLSGAIGDTQVPELAREVAFALIGLRIGLGFDREALRRIAETAWLVAIAMLALLLACFVLGWVLELTAGVSLLDGYLATTPGGLYAVLPIAYGAGADTTFVLAVQGLRLLGMIIAAPAVVRFLLRAR